VLYFLQALIGMNFRLQIFKQDANDDSLARRFRFAVVDLDKSGSFPSNFVCMLPAQVSGGGGLHSIFLQVFGDESLEQAKALLTEALDAEVDPEVKAEVERRLKLLEPKPVSQSECGSCGKLFQARRVRGFKQRLCPECVKKKFGSRE
jgi:hypothetical protein